ncbi:MAG TPA: hypothetical protein VFP05_15885, partial [Thermomicrobiales bacterium]|nr:hypothetical protein [Thermomicrobiales bacterium]
MDDAAARRAPSRLLLELAIVAICLVTIFPFLWMISTVFKESSEVFTKDIRFIPQHPTLQNIPNAFELFPVKDWIWNSFGIAALTT